MMSSKMILDACVIIAVIAGAILTRELWVWALARRK